MMRRVGLALVVFLAPAVGRAAEPPERLLTAGTQFYLRWDGVAAHRMAYDKTALGKMLQGDTGKFLSSVFTDLTDQVTNQTTLPQLLGGIPPDRLQKIQADAAQAPKLLETLGQHGIIIAAEIRKVAPPEAQLTLIFPKAGTKPQPFLGALRLAFTLAQQFPKEAKIQGRSVQRVDLGPVHVGWWIEGEDGVIVAGTDSLETAVKRSVDSADRITDNPLFQRLQAFKEFETGARGFLDIAGLVKVARSFSPEVGKAIDQLGLDGLKSVVIHSGFEGEAERGLVEIDLAAERKGLLRLIGGKPFRLGDLPPMPPDTITFTATRLNLHQAYEVAVEAAETVLRIAAPNQVPLVKAYLKQADTAVGINIRDDLLASLGDLFVAYTSPSEGPLNFGQTYLLQVKDAKKLQNTLEQAIRGIAGLTGLNIHVNKRSYHGAELHEVHIKQMGVPFMPTYAIHKDWLVVGFFPQSVKGFILRAAGELPAWKADPRTRETLEKMPAEMTTVTVSDPRPTVNQILSLAPIAATLIKSLVPFETKFDVGAIPTAQEATRHLFPNVTSMTDDGKTVRIQTRASLALPFELNGLDSYALAIAIPFLFAVGK